jgi:hypothetical protein
LTLTPDLDCRRPLGKRRRDRFVAFILFRNGAGHSTLWPRHDYEAALFAAL